jgi:hypothetical protein
VVDEPSSFVVVVVELPSSFSTVEVVVPSLFEQFVLSESVSADVVVVHTLPSLSFFTHTVVLVAAVKLHVWLEPSGFVVIVVISPVFGFVVVTTVVVSGDDTV